MATREWGVCLLLAVLTVEAHTQTRPRTQFLARLTGPPAAGELSGAVAGRAFLALRADGSLAYDVQLPEPGRTAGLSLWNSGSDNPTRFELAPVPGHSQRWLGRTAPLSAAQRTALVSGLATVEVVTGSGEMISGQSIPATTAFGLPFSPLGQATLTVEPNGNLLVGNLPGAPGPAPTSGVALYIGLSEGGELTFEPLDPSANAPSGWTLAAQATGSFDGLPDTAVGLVRAFFDGTSADILPNFPGATRHRDQAWSGPLLEFEAVRLGAVSATAAHDRLGSVGVSATHLPGAPAFTLGFPTDLFANELPTDETTTFGLGAGAFSGNTLRLMPAPSTAELESISWLTLGANGIDSLRITGASMEVFDHTHRVSGQATLHKEGDVLVVGNLFANPLGQDAFGVLFESSSTLAPAALALGGFPQFGAAFAEAGVQLSDLLNAGGAASVPGASLTFGFIGPPAAGFGVGLFMPVRRIAATGQAIELDPAVVEAAPFTTVDVYDQGALVLHLDLIGGEPLTTADSWPDEVRVIGFPMGLSVTWTNAADLVVAGIPVQGDRLHFSGGPCCALLDLSRVIVTAVGLEAFEITGEPTLASTPGWSHLGSALAGAGGFPNLSAWGNLQDDGLLEAVRLANAAPQAPALVLMSIASSPVDFKGGTLLAHPIVFAASRMTDAEGRFSIIYAWPAGVPSGFELYLQVAVADAGAPSGVALSNALLGTTP